MVTEVEGSCAESSNNPGNVIEMSNNDELLDQIHVPPLAPEERIVSAVSCNGGISYTTVAPSELGAVPEEDEEVATSSTPSTVVSFSNNTRVYIKKEFSKSNVQLCIFFSLGKIIHSNEKFASLLLEFILLILILIINIIFNTVIISD